ncbi:MAG: insulinase family protein [Planctomycetaceae bacterium]|nr:insulinase family protein [Planctomycetaceae bacterium]
MQDKNPTKHTINTLPNGLTIITERMNWCESAACVISIPAGSNNDPANREGLANLTCDMILRGAGQYNSRELTAAFENLGSERGESVAHHHTSFSTVTLSANLPKTLELFSQILLEPHFPKNQLGMGKQVVLQEIFSLEDEPARKMMMELARNSFPHPWGLPGFGTPESVQAISIEDVRRFHKRFYQPENTIVSVAGKFEPGQILETVTRLFGSWKPKKRHKIKGGPLGKPVIHIPYDSTQTHIGLTFPAVEFRHPDYLLAWSGVSVLSSGMSSRLFTEIREKRGLCYSVDASYYTYKDFGRVMCYCGTSVDRAQESLNVLLEELRRLSQGITEKELELLKIRAKSSLVMQQESTGSRAGSIARDWYHLGRIRTMQEIEAKINALTCETVNEYLAANPAGPFHLATLGQQPLEMETGVF